MFLFSNTVYIVCILYVLRVFCRVCLGRMVCSDCDHSDLLCCNVWSLVDQYWSSAICYVAMCGLWNMSVFSDLLCMVSELCWSSVCAYLHCFLSMVLGVKFFFLGFPLFFIAPLGVRDLNGTSFPLNSDSKYSLWYFCSFPGRIFVRMSAIWFFVSTKRTRTVPAWISWWIKLIRLVIWPILLPILNISTRSCPGAESM